MCLGLRDRLDGMVEEILDTQIEGATVEPAPDVPLAAGAVAAAGGPL